MREIVCECEWCHDLALQYMAPLRKYMCVFGAIEKLNKLAPLVTDPPRSDSNPVQYPPICKPLYIFVTSDPISYFQLLLINNDLKR